MKKSKNPSEKVKVDKKQIHSLTLSQIFINRNLQTVKRKKQMTVCLFTLALAQKVK